jgi:hypothetical protein
MGVPLPPGTGADLKVLLGAADIVTMAVPATIWTDDRGLIWVELGDEWPGFTRLLADSASSLSPTGETAALSTYWIDATLRPHRRRWKRPVDLGQRN